MGADAARDHGGLAASRSSRRIGGRPWHDSRCAFAACSRVRRASRTSATIKRSWTSSTRATCRGRCRGDGLPRPLPGTRRLPLILAGGDDDVKQPAARPAAYRADYAAYYQRWAARRPPCVAPIRWCSSSRASMPTPGPSGRRSPRVLPERHPRDAGAERHGRYQGLDEAEAFGIEYRSLEQLSIACPRLRPCRARSPS